MNNIVNGELDFKNLKFINLSHDELERLTLKCGDILFNRTNSKELVGKCAVFRNDGEFVFASYLIRLRVNAVRADPDYIAHVINSPIGRQQINTISRQIIGQANVNSAELRGLRIPLPPLGVQHKIMKGIFAARSDIANERAAAHRLMNDTCFHIQARIFGETNLKGEIAWPEAPAI